jgi:hypothetical protein
MPPGMLWCQGDSHSFLSLFSDARLRYRLDVWDSRVQFLIVAGNFSLHHHVQNSSGAHPASYPMGTRALFLGVKQLGCEADHSPPSSAEVKNVWSCTSTPQYAFMAWCSVKKSTGITLPLPQLHT